MTNKYHNMANAQLYKALDGAIIDTETGVREACRIVAELRRRGETVPLNTSSGVFRYWREINAEQLSPSTVLMFILYPKLLDIMRGVPLANQRAYAEGLKVDVASVDDAGQITTKAKDFRAITPSMHDVVLSPAGKLRTPEEQAAILQERWKAKCERKSTVKTVTVEALPWADEIAVNGVAVSSERLAEAMKALGYEFTRQDAQRSTPWSSAA